MGRQELVPQREIRGWMERGRAQASKTAQEAGQQVAPEPVLVEGQQAAPGQEDPGQAES